MTRRFENLSLNLKHGRHEITGVITDIFDVTVIVKGVTFKRRKMTVRTDNGYFITSTMPQAFKGYRSGLGAKVRYSVEITKVDFNNAQGRNPRIAKVIRYERWKQPKRAKLHSFKKT